MLVSCGEGSGERRLAAPLCCPDSHNHGSVGPSSSTVGDLGNTHAQAAPDQACVPPLTGEQRHAYDRRLFGASLPSVHITNTPAQALREADVSSSTGTEGGGGAYPSPAAEGGVPSPLSLTWEAQPASQPWRRGLLLLCSDWDTRKSLLAPTRAHGVAKVSGSPVSRVA